ncbi:unnamed protein product, partial [Urochloa humidicola]
SLPRDVLSLAFLSFTSWVGTDAVSRGKSCVACGGGCGELSAAVCRDGGHSELRWTKSSRLGAAPLRKDGRGGVLSRSYTRQDRRASVGDRGGGGKSVLERAMQPRQRGKGRRWWARTMRKGTATKPAQRSGPSEAVVVRVEG